MALEHQNQPGVRQRQDATGVGGPSSSLYDDAPSTANMSTQQQPRRSSRAVAKPDFKALENYGGLLEGEDMAALRVELLDEEDDGFGSTSHHHRRNSSGGGTSNGSGASNGGKRSGGSGLGKHKTQSKNRRPAALDDLEVTAKKLEDEIVRLQNQLLAEKGRLVALQQENAALRLQT